MFKNTFDKCIISLRLNFAKIKYILIEYFKNTYITLYYQD